MRASLPAILPILLAAFAAPVAAQPAGVLPLAGELPASTRSMALGDAYAMDSGHADAIFYHPALVIDAQGFGLDVQRWGPHGTSAAVSAATGWLGGGVAVGIRTLHFAPAAQGSRAAPGGQDHLFVPGPVPASERIASLAYARELFGVDVGVVANHVEERVGDSDDTAVLFDVGVATDVGPLRAGLSWRNLATEVEWSGLDDERADRVTLGLGGYGEQVGPLDVGASAAASYVGGDWLASGGVEVGYWPIQGRTFVGRVGVQRVPEGDGSPFSFGFAFWGDDVTLEWAFRPFDGADEGGTHRFGVRWR